jgi:sRNA-binding protein
MFAGALAMFAGGCATSAETERRAEVHDQRARNAAAYENYDQAAAEKHEANRLHEKAATERANESYDGDVPPAPVPPPPAPVVEVPPPAPIP